MYWKFSDGSRSHPLLMYHAEGVQCVSFPLAYSPPKCGLVVFFDCRFFRLCPEYFCCRVHRVHRRSVTCGEWQNVCQQSRSVPKMRHLCSVFIKVSVRATRVRLPAFHHSFFLILPRRGLVTDRPPLHPPPPLSLPSPTWYVV